MMEAFLTQCETAVLQGDRGAAGALAKRVLAERLDLQVTIERGFARGIRKAGALWEQGEYFLPELAFSAEAMKAAMAVLEPALAAGGGEARAQAKVIIGTVQGDIHDIGKSLVATMLLANGYDVLDLGADVPHERFMEEIARRKPHLLCMSALLTTTMAAQGRIIDLLTERGLRAGIKVLVGGAPTDEAWAREIGADAHAANAVAAVAAADALLAR